MLQEGLDRVVRELRRLASMEDLTEGYTWSAVVVPLVWATASALGTQEAEGRLASIGMPTRAVTRLRAWWVAQGVHDVGAAAMRLETLRGCGAASAHILPFS